MIIRNKFNGYGFDGVRLYHDPISLSIAATKAGAASSAAAAAAAAAKTAAATTAATTAATAAAGKTAALELAKKEAIAAGMKQAGTETAKQGIAQAAKQTGVEAAKQSSVEAAKQGIFSNPTGMPPTAGPVNPAAPLNPAGNQSYLRASTADVSGGAKPVEFLQNTNGMSVEQAQTLNNQIMARPPIDQSQMMAFKQTPPIQGKVPEFITPDVGLPGKPPLVGDGAFVKGAKASPDPGTFARAGSNAAEQGIAQMNTAPTSELMLKPTFETQFPLAPKSALAEGFETGLQFVKDNPTTTGLGLMTAGQYMNKPKEEDKDKYKNTVNMSGFQVSDPVQSPFTRSYDYQSYAVGGPVEQMSAMNATGANTGYPMAGINTPVYSNPMMQRPEATNVLAPSAGAGVGTYSGEARYAEGGLSEAQRREYGLSTRGQRASRNLSKSYEEMEEARQKEAMKLFGERSDPGIVPRSRTQMMSSPFSAALAEHGRLGKKAKVPVVEMPKTNLGDIDNYMDIPIEAAGGGIMHGLGGYSDGGRLLKGPGDGVSDSIPAVIGKRQPARLADGEFVIPARIVSELGNGSTEAGARKLYAMMERVQNTRKKSIGKKKVAVNSKADKHLPA
jgi:hypothetical protein